MKKIILFMIIAVMSLSLLSACAGVTAAAEEYIAIDYGEAGVQFVVDSNEKVIAFGATTLEGEALIDEEDLSGISLDEALDIVTDNALELGYLDSNATLEDPNPIMITTEKPSNRNRNRWKEQLFSRVDNAMVGKGIWAVLIDAEEINEIKSIANQYGISVARVRVVMAMQRLMPELSYEAVQEMTPNEITAMLKDEKPIRARIAQLEAQKASIENELLTLDEVEDLARIDELNAELSQVELDLAVLIAAKDTVVADALARREAKRAEVESFREQAQERAQAIRQQRGNIRGKQSQEIAETKRDEIRQRIMG